LLCEPGTIVMFILLWNCFFVIALFYFYFWTLVILQFKTLCLLLKCNTFICHLVIVNALNNELFIFFLFIIIHPALITSPYTLGYQSYVIWIGNLPLVTNLMWSESEIYPWLPILCDLNRKSLLLLNLLGTVSKMYFN